MLTVLASDPIVADLIDRTYEAAFNPGAWPELLDRIGHMAEGQGCALIRFGARTGPFVASEGMERLTRAFFAHGFSDDPAITGPLRAVPGGRFFGDHLFVPAEARAGNRLYREFMHPNKADFMAAGHLPVAGEDPFVAIVTRKRGAEPIDGMELAHLTLLHGHLGRAVSLSARMEAERLRGAVGAFSMAGFAACAVDAEGLVVEANDRMATMKAHAFCDGRQVLRIAHGAAQARFEASLAHLKLTRNLPGAAPMSFAVPAGLDRMPAVIHLVPVVHDAINLFARAAAFVIIVPVNDINLPQGELIQGLFDLSPAEARILGLLASCMDVGQIADTLGISRETVRFHLKNIFSKTGVSRQFDLAAKLAALPSFHLA